MRIFFSIIIFLFFPLYSQAYTCLTAVPAGPYTSGQIIHVTQWGYFQVWISQNTMTPYGSGWSGCSFADSNGKFEWLGDLQGDGLYHHLQILSRSAVAAPDSDGDGVTDPYDQCSDTPPPIVVDASGCGPAEPATCSNGIKDESESGIDCGDASCIGDETCTTYCPVGFQLESRPPDYLTACYSTDTNQDYTVDAKLGVCPANYFKSNTDTTKCVTWSFPTFASNDYLDPVEEPELDTTPWNNVFTQDNTTYANSTETVDGVTTDTTTVTKTGTSDTGAAVETVTTTVTVTQPDGTKTETITENTAVKNDDGQVTGGVITTTKNYAPTGELVSESTVQENIESEPGAGALFQTPTDGTAYTVDTEKSSQFGTRYSEFKDAVLTAPIYAPINNIFSGYDSSGKSPDFSLSMGSYGTKSLSLTTYDSAFSVLGIVFVFMSLLAAGRLVMINKG